MIVLDLHWGAVLFSFLAAIFWFISAAGKTPISDKTFGGFLNTPDAIIAALKYSAKWNWLASIFSALAALFLMAVMMNPRHAAARALVGWYLVHPPIIGDAGVPARAGLSEPLGEWYVDSSYDAATECEAAREVQIQKCPTDFTPGDYLKSGVPLLCDEIRNALCVATDDPRLKKK